MKTLWTAALSMAALAAWLRLSPSSGFVDVRAFLLAPIYLLFALGLAFGVARVVVHGRDLPAFAGALALFAFAVGVLWPDTHEAPWPWTLLG